MNWKKVVVHVDEYPVTIYVNSKDTRAVVFPIFGRFYGLWSDESALTFAVSFVINPPSKEVMTHAKYLSCQEDTAVIFQEAA